MRYIEAANGSNAAPKTILELATAPASGAVTLRLIWDGQTAPTPSARDLSKNAGATVAGGMGKDGYIYAMRAIGTQEQAFSWFWIFGRATGCADCRVVSADFARSAHSCTTSNHP